MTRKEWRRRVVLYRAHDWMKRLIWEEGLSFDEAIRQSIGVCIQNGIGPYAFVRPDPNKKTGFRIFQQGYKAIGPGATVEVKTERFDFVEYPAKTKIQRLPMSCRPYLVEYDIHRISRNIDRCIEEWTDMVDGWKALYAKTFNERRSN